jgi:putative oxidoreductase
MTVDLGLTILRVVIGLILAAHGSQKVFGWFGGSGLKGFSAGTKRMGFRPPLFWAVLAALGEFGGGLLLALGLLTPLAALGIMGAMFVALVKAHWAKGFWNSKGGIEYTLTLWATAFSIGLAGPGAYSLDALIGWPVQQPLAYVIVTAALMVALWVVMRVSKPQATPPQPAPAQPAPPAAQPESQPTPTGQPA